MFAADPLPKLRAQLAAAGHGAKLDAIDAEIGAFVEDCIKIALAVPRPDPAGMEADLFAPAGRRCRGCRRSTPSPNPKARTRNRMLTMAQALNRALRKILARAARVDRARPGHRDLRRGVQGHRGSLQGVRPAAGVQHARWPRAAAPATPSAWRSTATGRSRSSSSPTSPPRPRPRSCSTPATMPFPLGRQPARWCCACRAAAASPSARSTRRSSSRSSSRCPGLKALYPSNPQDAFNALLAAYEDDNPVLLFEHKGLYRRGKHPVTWDPHYRDIWQPEVRPPRRFRHARHLRRDGAPGRRGLRLLRRRIRAEFRGLRPALPLAPRPGRHPRVARAHRTG